MRHRWSPAQVLVRMDWAGVNGGCETFRARGEYAFAKHSLAQGQPILLGAEGAGEVVAVGSGVRSLQVCT